MKHVGAVLTTLTFLELNLFVEGFDQRLSYEGDDRLDSLDRIFYGLPGRLRYLSFVVKLVRAYEPCTGSIIENEWILTAGHCLSEEVCEDIRIYPEAWPDGLMIKPLECILHPNYTDEVDGIDLGLIKIKSLHKDTCLTGRAHLPDRGSNIYVGSTAMIAGYGKTERGTFPEELLSAYVDVKDWYNCNLMFQEGEMRNDPHWVRVNLPKKTFCTLGKGRVISSGHCFGDDGGPVLINQVLQGVVSFIQSDDLINCTFLSPSFHVMVVEHLEWIYSHYTYDEVGRRERFVESDEHY